MNNRVLKLIVLVENILSIYRNYDSFSITKKIIVSLRIALDIILILIITFVHVPTIEHNYAHTYRLTYFYINVTFSLFIISLAAYKSTKFNSLINYLEETDVYFSGDEIYMKNILREYKMIKIILILYGIIACSVWFYKILIITPLNDKAIFIFVLVVFLICEMRYVVEYIVSYGILAVLSEQVKSITRSIGKDTTVIFREVHEMQTEISRHSNFFSKQKQIYSTSKDCSNLINNVFGVEILIFLIVATIYNILLCYSSIANYPVLPHPHLVYIVYREIIFMIAFLLLARGAQVTQNSVVKLQRCLAGLLIRSTADKTCKVIRDFLRLVTKQPLKTQAFGSVTINMSLIPKFIMFFTSYTVIALQFNNVM